MFIKSSNASGQSNAPCCDSCFTKPSQDGKQTCSVDPLFCSAQHMHSSLLTRTPPAPLLLPGGFPAAVLLQGSQQSLR
jgi:hypothetical protein